MSTPTPGLDPAELAQFDRLTDWWDPKGSMAPLHRINPVRLAYVRAQLARERPEPSRRRPFAGLSALDIGCGGGLVAEPLARLGADVTAIDPSPAAIALARTHAAEAGLTVAYRVGLAEDLVAEGRRFDLVLALEVVEHVPDVPGFLATCAALVAEGGTLVLATINRTAKAYALAIVAAERVLRWLPVGTHTYDKLVKPEEIAAALAPLGFALTDTTGMAYDALRDRWELGPDLAVNYLATARRRA